MKKVESCFQRLEQRYALFTPGPARACRFLETVSPAPAAVVRTTLLSIRQRSQKSTRTQKSGHYTGNGFTETPIPLRKSNAACWAACASGLSSPGSICSASSNTISTYSSNFVGCCRIHALTLYFAPRISDLPRYCGDHRTLGGLHSGETRGGVVGASSAWVSVIQRNGATATQIAATSRGIIFLVRFKFSQFVPSLN